MLPSVAERKLAEMKVALHVVDEEVGGLEEQQTELLRQLAGVQQQITAAKAKRVCLMALHTHPAGSVSISHHAICCASAQHHPKSHSNPPFYSIVTVTESVASTVHAKRARELSRGGCFHIACYPWQCFELHHAIT